LKQGEEGTPVAEIYRKAGISQATYFNWKKKYAGLLPTEMKRLKQLVDENGRLKKIVADLTLDREMLRGMSSGERSEAPSRACKHALPGKGIGCASWSAGCAAIGRSRSGRRVAPLDSTVRRSTTNPAASGARQGIAKQCPERDQAAVEKRIKEICETRVRYGYRRVHVLLDREGRGINIKKVYRIYRELGMQLRNKTPKRRVKAKLRDDRAEAVGPNDVWAMDFVHDQLATGKKLRVLTVVDTFSRYVPVLDARFSYRGEDVVATLDRNRCFLRTFLRPT
jgi:transposase